jgi:carbamoyl-phosphate synthase large subunit
MPKRTDINTILVLGSGPIVIGQACEFDYSGTQACRVLRDEGYKVILANSNPATIMTDPDFADRTYVEPLDADVIRAIIDRERPDALLPTLGGQTALNLAMELTANGTLDEFGVELIGANAESIQTAEVREEFKAAMGEIGLAVPESGFAYSVQEATEIAESIGYPIMIRPSFILGGKGTGIANTPEDLLRLAQEGIDASPRSEILVERSIAGWKEYELEVIRDHKDNCIVVCSIENLDPMGVHTGDSITVAPIQTLTDIEYQQLRDASFAVIRRIGVDTGGSNVQFAVNPDSGEMVVIEMNPRVSRSSALASKATGFPIAKIAARLAVGYTLDELGNDITGSTPASFEPTIDYVVTKIPRWAFEKFPEASSHLGSRMQSVGEVMAIGRTFPESLQKAIRSLENGRAGLNCDPGESALADVSDDELVRRASTGTPDRIFQLEAALRRGVSAERLHEATQVDAWFLDQMLAIVEQRQVLEQLHLKSMTRLQWKRTKQLGFSDAQLAFLWGIDEATVRTTRTEAGVLPTYKTVDTCGAEFDAQTPYHYSTYEDDDESRPTDRTKVIILGSGPNRIGQGVEFDYCCVHASFALRDANIETIMVNCNPETVSTDYDTSDRLYFEPLTYEDVMNVVETERKNGELLGVIVSLGGQTPLKLASLLPPEFVLGTSPEAIDKAEDRRFWNEVCDQLGIAQPSGGVATSFDEAIDITNQVGYPVLVRPSYVLGGRAMRIVYNDDDLALAMAELLREGSLGREGGLSSERPVLIDRFLEDAIEVDVDAVRDRDGDFMIGGVMEHIEEAGVHSGDSSCVLPPPTLDWTIVNRLEGHVRAIADALDVQGLINVQFAVVGTDIYAIEANPRASRTVPFVAKATGVPLAKIAARVQAGALLDDLRSEGLLITPTDLAHVSVKAPVLPFDRFPDTDTLLLPEMRSTGEVMGIDTTLGMAFAKSQLAAGMRVPRSGTVFMSLADRDKEAGLPAAVHFLELGFAVIATEGTAAFLADRGLNVTATVAKVGEEGADAVDLISHGKVDLVINTPREGRTPRADGAHIRDAAHRNNVACVTTAAAARAVANGVAAWRSRSLKVRSLQELHAGGQGKLPV